MPTFDKFFAVHIYTASQKGRHYAMDFRLQQILSDVKIRYLVEMCTKTPVTEF